MNSMVKYSTNEKCFLFGIQIYKKYRVHQVEFIVNHCSIINRKKAADIRKNE